MPSSENEPNDTGEKPTKKKSIWRRILRRFPWKLAAIAVAIGAVAVVAVDTTDYYFSSENFCAFTCHVMESTVYQELQKSKHWTTPSGVRPKCADCPRDA